MRHLHLYLSPTRIQEIAASAEINPDTVELIDAIGVADPQIEAIALSYFSELRAEGLEGSQTRLLLHREETGTKQGQLNATEQVWSSPDLLASNIPFVPLCFYTGKRHRFVTCSF